MPALCFLMPAHCSLLTGVLSCWPLSAPDHTAQWTLLHHTATPHYTTLHHTATPDYTRLHHITFLLRHCPLSTLHSPLATRHRLTLDYLQVAATARRSALPPPSLLPPSPLAAPPTYTSTGAPQILDFPSSSRLPLLLGLTVPAVCRRAATG